MLHYLSRDPREEVPEQLHPRPGRTQNSGNDICKRMSVVLSRLEAATPRKRPKKASRQLPSSTPSSNQWFPSSPTPCFLLSYHRLRLPIDRWRHELAGILRSQARPISQALSLVLFFSSTWTSFLSSVVIKASFLSLSKSTPRAKPRYITCRSPFHILEYHPTCVPLRTINCPADCNRRGKSSASLPIYISPPIHPQIERASFLLPPFIYESLRPRRGGVE